MCNTGCLTATFAYVVVNINNLLYFNGHITNLIFIYYLICIVPFEIYKDSNQRLALTR